MRRAPAMPHSVSSLPPFYRHSRLTIVRRGCWMCRNVGIHGEAMYTAPDCAARAALQAPNRQWWGQGAAPLAFSWGSKGAILSRERMAPLSRAAPTALLPRAFGTKKSSLCRENSFSLFFNTALRLPECGDPPSANAIFLRRFRDARRISACRRSRCPSSCAGAG